MIQVFVLRVCVFNRFGTGRTLRSECHRPRHWGTIFSEIIFFILPAIAISASADTVPNFSFELPALPNGANNNGGNGDTTAIANWTIAAPAGNTNNGVYHPAGGFSSTNPLPAPADQNQLAYLVPGASNTSSITTSASLGMISSNTVYTLTVALGNRNDNLFFDTGTYTIDLLANGVSVAESTRAGSAIAHGTFSDLSAIFTSPASGPLIGESLTIRLSATAGSANDEAILDNVRLTSAPVPEPAISALMVVAIAIFVLRQRSRVVS
jgi:hypothetical protein